MLAQLTALGNALASVFGLGRRAPPAFEPDLAYGPDPMHLLDVYHPAKPSGRVIVMVHGGGWWRGDKDMPNVVANKVAHYLPLGYTFISIDYRLGTDIDPLDQADDVARSLAYCQGKARAWGCNPDQFTLMGHSAGAHLAALLASAPTLWLSRGVRQWLGTIALDSAAYDVPAIMSGRHPSIYDKAFGPEPSFWRAASPIDRLSRKPQPMLLVAGVTGGEETERYENVQAFAAKAERLGGRVQILPEDLSHGDCNGNLGLPGPYTDAVDAFLWSLLPTRGA